jgi:hypothetical protein
MNASVKNNTKIAVANNQQQPASGSDFKSTLIASTPTAKPNAPVDLPPDFTGTLFGGKFTASVLNGTATYLVKMSDGRAASFEGRKGNNKIEAKDWAAGSSVMKSLTTQLQKQKQSITQAQKSKSSQKQVARQPSTSDGLIPYIPFTPVTPLQIPQTGNGIIDAISSVPNAIWGGTMAAGNGISKGMNGMANIPAAVLNSGVSTAGYIYDSATKKDKNGKTRVDRALHTKLQDLPEAYVRHSRAGFKRIVAEQKQKEAQYAADVKKNGAVNTFITNAFATLTPYVVGGKAVTRKATPAPNPQKLLAPAVGAKPQKLLAPAKEQLAPVKNSSVTPQAVWEKEVGAGQTSVKSKPIKAPESTPVLQPVTASEALRLKAASMPKHPLSAAKFNSMSLESGDKSFTSSRGVQYARDTFKAAEEARKSGNFGLYNAKEANEIVAHLKSELARAEARLLPAKTIKPAEEPTKRDSTPVGSLARDNSWAAYNGGHQGSGSIGIGKQNSIHNMTSHADDGLGGGKGLPQEPPGIPEILPEQASAANTPKPFAEPTPQTPIKGLEAGKQAQATIPAEAITPKTKSVKKTAKQKAAEDRLLVERYNNTLALLVINKLERKEISDTDPDSHEYRDLLDKEIRNLETAIALLSARMNGKLDKNRQNIVKTIRETYGLTSHYTASELLEINPKLTQKDVLKINKYADEHSHFVNMYGKKLSAAEIVEHYNIEIKYDSILKRSRVSGITDNPDFRKIRAQVTNLVFKHSANPSDAKTIDREIFRWKNEMVILEAKMKKSQEIDKKAASQANISQDQQKTKTDADRQNKFGRWAGAASGIDYSDLSKIVKLSNDQIIQNINDEKPNSVVAWKATLSTQEYTNLPRTIKAAVEKNIGYIHDVGSAYIHIKDDTHLAHDALQSMKTFKKAMVDALNSDNAGVRHRIKEVLDYKRDKEYGTPEIGFELIKSDTARGQFNVNNFLFTTLDLRINEDILHKALTHRYYKDQLVSTVVHEFNHAYRYIMEMKANKPHLNIDVSTYGNDDAAEANFLRDYPNARILAELHAIHDQMLHNPSSVDPFWWKTLKFKKDGTMDSKVFSECAELWKKRYTSSYNDIVKEARRKFDFKDENWGDGGF